MRRWKKEEIQWMLSHMENLIREGNPPKKATGILAAEFSKQVQRNISPVRLYRLYYQKRGGKRPSTDVPNLEGNKILVKRVTDKLWTECDTMEIALRMVVGDVKQYMFCRAQKLIVEYKTVLVVKEE